jgi:hypothetical protein
MEMDIEMEMDFSERDPTLEAKRWVGGIGWM